MNRISEIFGPQERQILSVYFTAGFPKRNSTQHIITSLAKAGADMIEIGIPFSDPVADGPVIQQSNLKALQNGMTLALLLKQVKEVRNEVSVPLLLMGYLNPVLQYGPERFCRDAAAAGIDGLILPDLPLCEYEVVYAPLFLRYGLKHAFLITPQTSEERIRYIDGLTDAFIYMVTASATTGSRQALNDVHLQYFTRVKELTLKNPLLAGFGISDAHGFKTVCDHLDGAVIGSSFIRTLDAGGDSIETIIHEFIKQIRS